MGIVRLQMSQKEINEGRRAGIPDSIVYKMSQGYELAEGEKSIVNGRGKVYVLGHTTKGGKTLVKPHLRNDGNLGKITNYTESNEFWAVVLSLSLPLINVSDLDDDEIIEKYRAYGKIKNEVEEVGDRRTFQYHEKVMLKEIKENLKKIKFEIGDRAVEYKKYLEKYDELEF